MRFKDRIAVVTGGGSGIGLAAARLLAAEGAKVAVNDSREEAAAEAVRLIEADGGEALAVVGDVSVPEVVDANVRTVIDRFGRIDILVGNAGMSSHAPAISYDWRRSLSVNLDGAFYWSRAVARDSMLPNGRGAIVLTSSGSGFAATPNDVGYVASKHGVIGLTKALAIEWAPFGIRVNSIAPGLTDSLMVREIREKKPDMVAAREARIPIGRIGQPEDLAKAILFLASDDAAYVTGHIMSVDGGQLALHSGFTISAG
jgi:NAD(P)-dependent dehydrogenase (short-subunit alcohol dehydrogenase family)